jgi:hypothetical protein
MTMPFPEKFRKLVELHEEEVTIPDYVWLAYAVCATEEDSCGWHGWIIESAWKIVGGKEVEVEADAEQGCPICGKQVYRTEVEKRFRFDPSSGPKLNYSHESAPLSFKEPEPKSKT